MSISQRLPHCDSHDPARVAFVHYLDPSEASGGTAFFRHRSTGFETVAQPRAKPYHDALAQELTRHPPEGYPAEQTPVFTRTGVIEPVFNRLIVFRGITLHGGLIRPDDALAASARQGRLTLNTMLQLDA